MGSKLRELAIRGQRETGGGIHATQGPPYSPFLYKYGFVTMYLLNFGHLFSISVPQLLYLKYTFIYLGETEVIIKTPSFIPSLFPYLFVKVSLAWAFYCPHR